MVTTVARCITHGQYDVALNVLEDQSTGAISYELVYGLHRETHTDAMRAFKEFSSCVRHALACNGLFDTLDECSDHEL